MGDVARALDALERSRARALLDQMELHGTDLLAGVPEEEAEKLRRREGQALGRVNGLEKQLEIIKKARESGKDVARLHTGDPSIYGAIQEQMKLLDAESIDYEVIPGVSSFLASAAALKQELTLPGVSQTVIITRVEGQTPVPAKESLRVLAQSKSTLCIFLSVSHIEKIVEELQPSYGPDCPAAVVYKSTWKDQKIVCAPLSGLAEAVKKEGIKKTALIILGEVLTQRFERSHVYQP